MAATAPTRILRIGVFRAGKIVHERLLRRPEAVTIGRDPKNAVVVAAPGIPASFPLFEPHGGGYRFGFVEGMVGTVAVDGAPADLGALKAGPKVLSPRPGLFQVELDPSARGRVALGDTIVLFQFVAPRASRPAGPAPDDRAVGGVGAFFATADRLFANLLIGFLLASYAMVFLVSQREVTEQVTLDEIPDRMVRMIMPERPEAPPPEEPPAEETAVAKAETKPQQAAKRDAAPKAAAGKSELEKAVGAAGLLAVIGSEGDGLGALDDVLSSGTGPADVAAALAGATRVGVATADNLGTLTRGGGTGTTAGIGDLGTTGGGNVGLAAKREVVVARVETGGGPEVESSSVDRQAVARFVQSRLAGIKACYEKELKRNPSLAGRIVVRFVIAPTGRVSSVEIEENALNPGVASCIRTIVRGWSLPFKPDEEVPVSYPFLFQPG
jgi:outer membrane biosynthesis protein TonB